MKSEVWRKVIEETLAECEAVLVDRFLVGKDVGDQYWASPQIEP
jgi:hypothetical protein